MYFINLIIFKKTGLVFGRNAKGIKKMKVYILEHTACFGWEGTQSSIVGIFSSRLLLEQFVSTKYGLHDFNNRHAFDETYSICAYVANLDEEFSYCNIEEVEEDAEEENKLNNLRCTNNVFAQLLKKQKEKK